MHLDYKATLLLNTKDVRNTLYSFLVRNLLILSNPQITKARSENFKSKIDLDFWLSMWVGISEAICLLSTSLGKLAHYFTQQPLFFPSNISRSFISLFKPTYLNVSYYSTAKPATKDKFNEWLAGLIDGDGCFQLSKKGYGSLEIVMELRDKHCLYQVKQKYGGSVKLRAGDNHLRYRLHHKTGLIDLVNGVNGLLRNPIRIIQLGKICLKYNIDLKDSKPLTYYDGWLAGFFDADGSIYMNESSGQLLITVSQKNRLLLDRLVNLYGGQIYPMIKQGAFKWTCFRKDEIIFLTNNYFKVNPSRSEKQTRLNMVEKFYELWQLHAHIAGAESVLGKAWKNYKTKWDNVVFKDK